MKRRAYQKEWRAKVQEGRKRTLPWTEEERALAVACLRITGRTAKAQELLRGIWGKGHPIPKIAEFKVFARNVIEPEVLESAQKEAFEAWWQYRVNTTAEVFDLAAEQFKDRIRGGTMSNRGASIAYGISADKLQNFHLGPRRNAQGQTVNIGRITLKFRGDMPVPDVPEVTAAEQVRVIEGKKVNRQFTLGPPGSNTGPPRAPEDWERP